MYLFFFFFSAFLPSISAFNPCFLGDRLPPLLPPVTPKCLFLTDEPLSPRALSLFPRGAVLCLEHKVVSLAGLEMVPGHASGGDKGWGRSGVNRGCGECHLAATMPLPLPAHQQLLPLYRCSGNTRESDSF